MYKLALNNLIIDSSSTLMILMDADDGSDNDSKVIKRIIDRVGVNDCLKILTIALDLSNKTLTKILEELQKLEKENYKEPKKPHLTKNNS